MENKLPLMVLLLLITCSTVISQNRDFVIVKPTATTQTDTIFGEIIFPKNGLITKVKIQTNNEKLKFPPNKALAFKYGERYFASVPYNSRYNVFAERIKKGKIELYYYDSNPQSHNSGVAGVAATSLTSFFYIKLASTTDFIKVPHSRKKAATEISELFTDKPEIHNQIRSEDFRIWKLPEIVQKYNEVK